ncbi:stage V sporulation protein AA [Bacillus sp. V3B]|uniref:stage V sporulation protein AA n=1 Tax=Bacillus sp. V3B TaxID=2804915 RepID=UPI00210AF0A4|nr:stage V sporulation protein AA [Bacillus sp. V3B]MCQ6273816.1 stage V sporulation protein AA [Bacillus sp. V3B]
MGKTVYIRLRHRVLVRPHEKIFLKDIAQIITEETLHEQLNQRLIYQVSNNDRNILIIDVMHVVSEIAKFDPAIEVQVLGPSQTIIEVVYKKRKVSIGLFVLTWFLLFFGSMLTIMNFHEDVSMQDVHQRIYTMITGKNEEKPLLFQIPYSIGLGLGMIIFFNHVFKKRLNEEPSPLEVEMFNYQQDLDQYVIMHENKESVKKINDH